MSQAPILRTDDHLDQLAAVYRRLDALEAGGRVAEQEVAGRLIRALDQLGEDYGVLEPRYADGNEDAARHMVVHLALNAQSGDYGELPSWCAWALGLVPCAPLAYQRFVD